MTDECEHQKRSGLLTPTDALGNSFQVHAGKKVIPNQLISPYDILTCRNLITYKCKALSAQIVLHLFLTNKTHVRPLVVKKMIFFSLKRWGSSWTRSNGYVSFAWKKIGGMAPGRITTIHQHWSGKRVFAWIAVKSYSHSSIKIIYDPPNAGLVWPDCCFQYLAHLDLWLNHNDSLI